ncbi:hypothetical protein [Kitasatospora griseola]|uniref:hypothetical protein n=1 Tax=Kitasatospora griseola TaxID=2064 RepID=UPI003664517C
MPDLFRAIIEAESAAEVVGVGLEGHLEIEANLFEVAVPAVGVILGAMSGSLSPFARSQLQIMLWRLVYGESHGTEVAVGRARLGDECRLRAREGIWIVLQEGLAGDGEMMVDILEAIDLDDARLSYYKNIIDDRR